MSRVAGVAYRLAAVVVAMVLVSSGCDEAAGDVGSEAVAVHGAISSRIVVDTPKGPAEIWVTWDGREWTSGDSAFSGRPDAFREGLVVDTRKWPRGIVPYYWPISSASDCMSDQDGWCAGERDRAERISIDMDGVITPVGPVARGKLTLTDRSSTTFVDVTDLGTSRPPEAMRIIRQDWQLDGEQPIACDLADNSTAPEKWGSPKQLVGPEREDVGGVGLDAAAA